jgi:hypothetical protein
VDGFSERAGSSTSAWALAWPQLSLHPAGLSRHPSYGLGGAAWLGNQFIDGEEWSMGMTLRVVRTMVGDEAGEFDFQTTSLAASMLLTAMRR